MKKWLKDKFLNLPVGCIVGPAVAMSILISALIIICLVKFAFGDWSETSTEPSYIRGVPLKENDMQYAIRDKLETMLVRDEVGGTTVSHMLTVSHDGNSALVVGIGHDVVPGDDLKLGDTIHIQRAVHLFESDVTRAIMTARHVVDSFDSQPENVQIVTAALAFQLGESGLKSFRHMLEAIKAKDYDTAAMHLLDSKLARSQSHNRANREAELLKNGLD